MAKNKKTKLNKGRLWACLLAVCSVAVVISLAGRMYRLYQRNVDLTAARSELADLEKECEDIKEDIRLLEDENYITRYARENWVFTKEGETVIPLPEDAAGSDEE